VDDLDGDGAADLVTVNQSSDDVSVLLGNGDGTFQAAVSFAAGDSPLSIAIADLDGDSVPDLVTANAVSDDVSVLLGNGDGSFQPATSYPAGDSPRSVAAADLDGDSLLDLITANPYSYDVTVLLGNGDGSFQRPVSNQVPDGRDTRSMVVADLNGDSVLDLVTTTSTCGGRVNALLGNGDGSFRTAGSYSGGCYPYSVAVADLDGDSVPDLVVANKGNENVLLLLGNGDGTFQAAVSIAEGDDPTDVAVADFNGDSLPDFVTANFERSTITVFLNLCNPPTIPVDLDIKPGSDPNSINPSLEGVLPVALLGSESVDVADVNVMTLAFGPSGAPLAHLRGPHPQDVNGDGFTDLLTHYRIKETGIEFGDMEVCVTGELLNGTPFKGCDAIRTVPDMDGDDLLDIEEAAIGTDALNRDTDGDGFGDGEEVHVMGTDPLDPLDPAPAPVRERRGPHKRRR